MARDYQAEGLAILDAADAAGEIYNTQWQAAKDLLNRALEAEVKESLSHYDTSCNSSIYKLEQRDEKLYGITSAFCYTLHLLPSQAKKLARAKKFCTCNIALSLIAVLTVVVKRWEPISARVSAWKPLVKSGRKTLSAEERKTPVRTLENTGTCGICRQNVKLDSAGHLVSHGYRISDGNGNYFGFQSGRCFGAAYQPHELSREAVCAYHKILNERRTSISSCINCADVRTEFACPKHMETGPELRASGRFGYTIIGRSDPRFTQAKAAQINEWGAEVKQLDAAIAHYANLYKNWKLTKLPDAVI